MTSIRQCVKQALKPKSFLYELLAFLFRPPSFRKDRSIRNGIKKKKHLRWWLVYGPARTGTTYMVDLIATRARLKVSDWCLGYLLRLTPKYSFVHFDHERALRDISDNILDNAEMGRHHDLDLVFKQAQLETHEYKALVHMWGEPERRIYCFREPSGCMSSSEKMFSDDNHISIPRLQERYLLTFDIYKQIGGDPFEYRSDLTLGSYLEFLKPLPIDASDCKPFRYQGSEKTELVTRSMDEAFRIFKEELAQWQTPK